MKRSRLILIVALVLTTLAGTWLALPEDSGFSLIPDGNDESESCGEVVPEHTDYCNQSRSMELTPTLPPDNKFEIQTPTFTETLEIHEPAHGEALLRGGGIVKVEIIDAKGQLVNFSDSWIRLTRLLGQYSIKEDYSVNQETNQITCHGFNGAGLEPGQYVLEIASNTWGKTTHNFNVARGENRIDQGHKEPRKL